MCVIVLFLTTTANNVLFTSPDTFSEEPPIESESPSNTNSLI